MAAVDDDDVVAVVVAVVLALARFEEEVEVWIAFEELECALLLAKGFFLGEARE